MLILDLYCGAGGAATGYASRGADVLGVDITDQPSFPFRFMQADALRFLRHLIGGGKWILDGYSVTLADVDFIHASPPCQRYSAGTRNQTALGINRHPDLVAATRTLLMETGKPWVIENVEGAPLLDPVRLCGRMLGLSAIDTDGTFLQLDRHRLFEASFPIMAPPDCRPHNRAIQVGGVYGGARRNKDEARYIRGGGYVPASLAVLRALMGIDYMSEKELFLAIPPAYSAYVFDQWVS